MQDPRRIRTDLDTGSYLAKHGGPLVHVCVEARTQQRQRGTKPTDTAPDDPHGEPLRAHFHLLLDAEVVALQTTECKRPARSLDGKDPAGVLASRGGRRLAQAASKEESGIGPEGSPRG
jgi:hypothetical protein